MKILRILFIILFLSISFFPTFAQEIDFEGNWFREIGREDDYYTRFDFRNYTKEDVIGAKKRFLLIKQNSFRNEWEGVYENGTESGASEFHWNSAGGFVNFDVYHTLRNLDFGSAFDEADSIMFVSEKSKVIKRNSIFSTRLVKVKLADRHFLVPENRLLDFTERAVGISTELSDFGYYLYKLDEIENEVSGLPVLPKKYRNFLRSPIITKIVEVGERKIHQNKFDDGTLNYEEIFRFVTLGAGKNKNVKVGMNFFVEDLGEWVEITKVIRNTSVGRLRRDFGENGEEICRELELGQGIGTACITPKVGMKAKTKISDAFF